MKCVLERLPPRIIFFVPALLTVATLSGCATYIPPSGRADFSDFTSSSMRESFAAKPAAVFPVSIAVVRVQAPLYHNYYTDREGGVYGQGRYSVVAVKEVEDDADFQRITHLPHVGGLTGISTLLLPENLKSDRELREAAARLKSDMLLLYTFDTSFHENEKSVALAAISLGLSPTHKVSVHVTASAILMDTRTGFIYATIEANEKRQLMTNVWESRESADRARQNAERAAFKSLVADFEKSWPQIVERAHQGA
jgi:hypothetical protein